MGRYEVKNPLTPEGRNQINSMFEELYKEYIGAGNNAKDAREKALSAVLKSDEAMSLSERTQKELSQAILKGDSSPLGGQLSVGVDGTVYNNPQERLTKEMNSVNQQLAQNAEKVVINESANAKDKLNLFNYLGNTQNIHGKVLDMGADGWNGWRYWMAYTPYPEGDTKHENPCLAVSNDKINWTVPAGVTNPLKQAPENGYNNDTHLLYRPDTGELEIWWRALDLGTNKRWYWRKTSSDGSNWSDTETVWETPDYNGDMVSPCPEYDASIGKYVIYALHLATRTIRRIESDNPSSKTWSEPIIVEMDKTRCIPWHLDTIITDLGREFLVQGYEQGKGNNTSDLWHFVEKTNGELTKPVKIISRSASPDGFDNGGIYRSTFIKDSDGVYYVWYSSVGQDKSRSMALSYGRDITALKGYEVKKNAVRGNNQRIQTANTVIDGLDVRDIDIIYIQAPNAQLKTLRNGYRNQRVSFVIYSSTASLTIKYDSTRLVTPSNTDLYFDVNNQIVIDLICVDPNLDQWRVTNNVDHAISKQNLSKAVKHEIKSVLINGDLKDNTQWSAPSNLGTVVIANNEITYEVIEASSASRIEHPWTAVIGHRYFVTFDILPKLPTETFAGVGGATSAPGQSFIAVPNKWNVHEQIYTASGEGIFRIYHRTSVNDYKYLSGDTVKFRNINVIDLTETFGAGSEPSLKQMREIMSFYPKEFLYGLNLREIQEAIKSLQTATPV